ncbi:Hypothetical predicted protein [Mytilus galloprovincialis]|uniref:Chromo domain-containing protein n=1 Tax=Mytilus galloprovincialis TaxID=29158 RepID=A0A8B6G6S9_MYTGA|nr:Hypothetical predicted protein [Mytilus galloprovincialis]
MMHIRRAMMHIRHRRQEPNSLQKLLKRSFKRNRVIVIGIDDQWDVDLMDMSKFLKFNSGFNFILVVIDIFSKYVWLIHLYLPKRLQPKTEKVRTPFRFKIGDKVRITYIRNPFTREKELSKNNTWWACSLQLIDFQDEEISGTFYQSEVQKVDVREDDMWKVENIIKTKGKGPNKQYYVKWLHWPKKFNSWNKARDLSDI